MQISLGRTVLKKKQKQNKTNLNKTQQTNPLAIFSVAAYDFLIFIPRCQSVTPRNIHISIKKISVYLRKLQYFPICATQSFSEFAPRCKKNAYFLVLGVTMVQTDCHSIEIVALFSCEFLHQATQPI